ncbi:MAG: right-handed parallel beta-helix repeat-containing protein [Verrucomicrobiota bacterium]
MKNAVRRTLSEMMARPNREKLFELRRFEGMLKDLAPGERAESHVLLCGLKANLPQKLMSNEVEDLDARLTRLVDELGERFALEPHAAGWAVEAWAVALGVMPEEEAGRRRWRPEGEEEEPAAGPPGLAVKRSPAADWDPDSYVTVATAENRHEGDLGSVREALEAIRPGMKILVKPGVYRESLEIQKEVEIVGDGDATEVIIESIRDTTMAVCCKQLSLANLTLRAMTQQMRPGIYGLQVAEGRVRAKQCRFASSGDTAVIAYGQGSFLTFSQCLVGDGPGVGMAFMDMARGAITETEIYGQAAGCVIIRQWATPSFQRCRIHGSQVAGIMVSDYGVGSFVDCDIFDHWLSGVTITTGANPSFDRCRIHGARAHGVWIAEKGEGSVRNCAIYGNARGPIFVETGCRPKIANNEAPA